VVVVEATEVLEAMAEAVEATEVLEAMAEAMEATEVLEATEVANEALAHDCRDVGVDVMSFSTLSVVCTEWCWP